ncbi:MAG TPA: hypothetical protein VFO49_15560 [Nocardioides sp.]|nr:hypothetical protein [Nocardioides sp.]
MVAPSLAPHTPQVTDHAARRGVGRAFLAAAGVWVLYIVLAFTVSADYEEALVDASDTQDTPVNRLPAETLAQIGQDHPWSYVPAVVLLLAPALLIVATRRAAAVTGDRWGPGLAWLGAVVWWFYMLLNFGLLADPQDLPPLTRNLDVLTVPLVSAGSVLALVAFVVSAWSLRRHGWRRVASGVAALVAGVLLVLSVVTSVTSGWDEPVPPVGLLPAELILGIALMVGTRRR